jgi:branched-chain amino acid transport system ATP-binding protein
MSSQPQLSVSRAYVRYGDAEILKNISIDVNRGETITIIGANGAGKTTLLKTISGLVRLIQGSIQFNGEAIHGRPAFRIRRMGLIHVPEGRGILCSMSVHENLLMGAYGSETREKLSRVNSIYERFQRLKERKDQSGGSLSGGEQQMLAIARGLMGDPRCLMLDEPSIGLAPLMVSEIFRILRTLKESGITQLLVEQNAKQALDIADRAYVIEVGQIVAHGTAEDLSRDNKIVEAYLGI